MSQLLPLTGSKNPVTIAPLEIPHTGDSENLTNLQMRVNETAEKGITDTQNTGHSLVQGQKRKRQCTTNDNPRAPVLPLPTPQERTSTASRSIIPTNTLTGLPQELILKIFSFANSISDMRRLGQTCKMLHAISEDPHLPLAYHENIMNKKHAFKTVELPSIDGVNMNLMQSNRIIGFKAIGNYLFIGLLDGQIKIQDIESDVCHTLFQAHSQIGCSTTMHFSGNENRLATGTKNEVKLWDISNIAEPKCIWTRDLNLNSKNSQTLSNLQMHENRLMIVSDSDKYGNSQETLGKIEIFDLNSETPIPAYSIEREDLLESHCVLNRNQLFVANSNKIEGQGLVVRIWDIEDIQSKAPSKTIRISPKFSTTSFSPVNRNRVVTATISRIIKMWDIESQQCLYSFSMPKFEIEGLFLQANGKYLFGYALRNIIIVWNLESGEYLQTFYGGMQYCQHFKKMFQADEGRLITMHSDLRMLIWNIGAQQAFSMDVLENNLATIKKLTNFQDLTYKHILADAIKSPCRNSAGPNVSIRSAQQLNDETTLDELHPYFKELLFDMNKNALLAIKNQKPQGKVSATDWENSQIHASFQKNIFYLQTMAYVETLGCAIRTQNREKILEMISLLEKKGYSDFYKLLWEECKSKPLEANEYGNWMYWIPLAFDDFSGYSATLEQQINTVQKLKQIVRDNAPNYSMETH